MNYRLGDKACHFMQGNKVGTVVDIITESNNLAWSTGGSFENKIFIVLEYRDGTREKIVKSDLIKVF